jgi:hypothetical protein
MTGRGAGNCSASGMTGKDNSVYGRGMGRGCGVGRRSGRGMRRMHGRNEVIFVPLTEIDVLKNQAIVCRDMLDGINKRITQLETSIE